MFKIDTAIENYLQLYPNCSEGKNLLYFTSLYCHLVAPHIAVMMDICFATCVDLFCVQID